MIDPQFLERYREDIMREARRALLADELRKARNTRREAGWLRDLGWELKRDAGRLFKLICALGR